MLPTPDLIQDADVSVASWRVALIDDQPDRVQGPLESALHTLGVPVLIEAYGSVPEAAAKMARFRAHVMLHDNGGVWNEITSDSHDPMSGLVGLWALRHLFPESKSIVVSRLCEARLVGTALELGARGYFQVDELREFTSNGDTQPGAAQLALGISSVMRGGACFGPTPARALEQLETTPGPSRSSQLPLTVVERFDRDRSESEARELLDAVLRTRGDLKAVLARALADSAGRWRPKLHGDTRFSFFAGLSTEHALYATVGAAQLPLAEGVPSGQRDVAERVLRGLTQAEIAAELVIATRTVEDRLARLNQRARKDAPADMQSSGREKSVVSAQLLAGLRGTPIIEKVKVVTLDRPISRGPASLVA